MIQGLDLDTSRPKIDESTLDRYHSFSNQKEPSKGAIIQDLRKSSEELNVKVKHTKPSLSQLSTTIPSDSSSSSSSSTTASTSSAPTEEVTKKIKEIKIEKEPKEPENTKPKDTTATTSTTTTTFTFSSPSKTSFKMGGTIFRPKAKVLEPKYPLSIKGIFFDFNNKYEHSDTYPNWPQQTFQSQNVYVQQQQPQQPPPQQPQFVPIPFPYPYPYGAYYAQPTYYQPGYIQPGYVSYTYN